MKDVAETKGANKNPVGNMTKRLKLTNARNVKIEKSTGKSKIKAITGKSTSRSSVESKSKSKTKTKSDSNGNTHVDSQRTSIAGPTAGIASLFEGAELGLRNGFLEFEKGGLLSEQDKFAFSTPRHWHRMRVRIPHSWLTRLRSGSHLGAKKIAPTAPMQ